MITLEKIQYILTELALKHNLVGSAFSGPSIYQLNAEDIKEYPFMYFSPTGAHTLKENTTRFSFTVFYCDRLLEDTSNEDNIGSVAVETIRNFHLQLKKFTFITDMQEEIDVRLFTETERLADRCAGAYATFWIEVLNSTTCGSFFDGLEDELGNYFDDFELINILDNLASKEWVNRLVAGLSISGITPEEFERIMGKYVLERKFATINGSGITNNQAFNLVEQGGYDSDMQEIRGLISGNTQDISNLSASTTQEVRRIYQSISAATPADYDQVKAQVTANTQDISTISGATQALSAATQALSAATQALSSKTSQDISALSAKTNSNENKIAQLSGATQSAVSGINSTLQTINTNVSGISRDLGVLSGYTHQSVSSLTHDIETLSAAISGYTPQGYEALKEQVSANTSDIQELSGITSGLSSGLSDLSGFTAGLPQAIADAVSGLASETYVQNAIASAISNIDDYCFFVSGYSQPWDARNSDALVDYVKSLGDDWEKARVFVMTDTNPARWQEYRVTSVAGDTVNLHTIRVDSIKIEVINGSYTKNVPPSQSDWSSFELSDSINYNISVLHNSKQDKLSAGSGITIQNNVISADVASNDVHNIVSLAQSAYDALVTKDANTLYIIKPLY